MQRRRPMIQPEPEPAGRGFGRMKFFVVAISVLVFLGLGLSVFLATQQGQASLPPTPYPGSAFVISGELDQRAPGSYFSGYTAGDSVPFGPGSLARATRGLVELNLPGNYQLAVDGSEQAPALIELAQAGAFGRPSQNVIRLLAGSLVARTGPELDPGVSLVVDTDVGRATISGTVMGVRFNPETQVMEVDCFQGSCDVETGRAAAIRLEAGLRTVVDASGMPAPPGVAAVELYAGYPLRLWVAPAALEGMAAAAQAATFTPTASPPPLRTTPTATPVLPTWTPAPPTAVPSLARPSPTASPGSFPTPTPTATPDEALPPPSLPDPPRPTRSSPYGG